MKAAKMAVLVVTMKSTWGQQSCSFVNNQGRNKFRCIQGKIRNLSFRRSSLIGHFSRGLSYTPNNESNDMDTTIKSPIFSLVPRLPIFYNDVYEVDLPPNHRFPMQKYRMVREQVQAQIAALPAEERNLVDCQFHISPLATIDELTTTHCPKYVDRYLRGELTVEELRNIGFPWSHQHVNRSLSSVGGTIAAAQSVCLSLDKQRQRTHQEQTDQQQTMVWGAHVAGGTHHAFYDYGEGFCVFSDIAVAANVVMRRYPDTIRRILIVDLDVHQGNGNARLFHGNDKVVTFSMHCESNYFSPKESSDLDIELPAGCTDGTYLQTLRHWLKQLLGDNKMKFDLVFFQAGIDTIEEDRLGRMSLSLNGIRRRNELVFDFVQQHGAGLVITMGGGYPRSEWKPILDAHASVYFGAHQFLSAVGATWQKRELEQANMFTTSEGYSRL